MIKAKFSIGDRVVDKAGTIAIVQNVFADVYCIEIVMSNSTNLDAGQRLSFGIAEFESMVELYQPEPCQPETLPDLQPTTPILTLQDAYRFAHESKKPRYAGQAAAWHADGRCPKCGELGRFHLSAPICSKHGVY